MKIKLKMDIFFFYLYETCLSPCETQQNFLARQALMWHKGDNSPQGCWNEAFGPVHQKCKSPLRCLYWLYLCHFVSWR